MSKQTKAFGIYHWDTFNNHTIMMDEADTRDEAEKKVKDHYGDRISTSGANKVDIVNSMGNVIASYNVR